MLRAISNILSNCNRRYSALSVDKVNVIKTIISTLLGMVRSCETTDKIHISNFIASDDTLIEVIILLLNSKGSMYVHTGKYIVCMYACTYTQSWG